MQYNGATYNGTEYNLTAYSATLAESLSESDLLIKSIGIVKTDSQASVDALSDAESLAAFLETITIIQRAKTPFAYNNGMYNQYMYNARLDEDEILLSTIKVLTDSLGSSDVLAPFLIYKVLSESLVNTDAIVFSGMHSLYDFIFLSEYFTIQITNKALNDTLRMADWLSIERNPVVSEWYS